MNRPRFIVLMPRGLTYSFRRTTQTGWAVLLPSRGRGLLAAVISARARASANTVIALRGDGRCGGLARKLRPCDTMFDDPTP